jgi:DNA-binding NarL/FixJ family response regulator
MKMPRPRVILADDHAVLREGLVQLLEPEFEVAGAVGDGHALVAEAERMQPDLVVFDIGMPLLNGIEAAAQLHEVAPAAKLIFLTQHSGKEYIQTAFRLGASAYVMKNAAAAELLTALREALAGRYYVSAELRSGLSDGAFNGKKNPAELFSSSLTPRQRQVLQLVAEGRSAKEIAHILNISIKTVEFHKAAIMDELGLRTTAELTRYALEQGILRR